MPLPLPLSPSSPFLFLSLSFSSTKKNADAARGEKIFKTKCAQCHVAEKGGGHKQVSAKKS